MEKYKTNYKFLQDILIKEIVFEEESADVTLYGSLANPTDSNHSELNFICDFEILRDILLHLGEIADPVLTRLIEILDSGYIESPSNIDLENTIGCSLTISDLVFKVYTTMTANEDGEWVEDEKTNIYFIESLITKSVFLEQQKKEKQLAEYRKKLFDHMCLLEISYKSYRHLVAHKFSEEEARNRSGLSDEMLFRIAVLSHKLKNLQK